MNKHITFILSSILIILFGGVVKAQNTKEVSNYLESFENLDTKAGPNGRDFAPPSWGRILDYLKSTDWEYDDEYVKYSNPSTGGQQGAFLEVGTQALAIGYSDFKTAKDMIVTPPMKGKVQFYLIAKGRSSYSRASVAIYSCKRVGDKYVAGDTIRTISNDQLSRDEWRQFELELSDFTMIGFRLENIGIDELSAEQARVALMDKLEILYAKLVGSNKACASPQNEATFKVRAVVKNSGNTTLKSGTPNYELRIVNNSQHDAVVATHALTQELAPGTVSDTIEVPFTVTVTDEAIRNRYDIQEAFLETSRMIDWITVYPYKPEFVLTMHGQSQEINEPIDLGLVYSADKSVSLRVKNDGGAPMVIRTIDLPDGFTIGDVALPLTVAPLSEKNIMLTLSHEAQKGPHNGEITFNIDGIGKKSYSVRGHVIGLTTFYENFETGTAPKGWILEKDWRIQKYNSSLATEESQYYADNSLAFEPCRLITPRIHLAAGERMTFFAGRKSFSSTLTVYYSTDRKEWIEAMAISSSAEVDSCRFSDKKAPDGNAADYYLSSFQLPILPEEDYYFAFEGAYCRVDDIFGGQLNEPQYDFFFEGRRIPSEGMVNQELLASIVLYNMTGDTIAPSDYKLSLELSNGQSVPCTDQVAILPYSKCSAQFNYTPHAVDTLTVVPTFTVNEYVLKGEASRLTVQAERGWHSHTVVAGEGSTPNAPVRSMDNHSQSESLYTADQLGLQKGQQISQIAYYGKSSNKDPFDQHIVVYIENTTDTKLATTENFVARDTTDMTLVVDTVLRVTVNEDPNAWEPKLVLNLAKPFVYDGASLRVSVRSGSKDGRRISFQASADKNPNVHYRSASTDLSDATWSDCELPTLYVSVPYDPAVLSGTVTDVSSSQPIEGASITLQSDNVLYQSATDQSGHYSIPVYQTGRTYALSVTAHGYKDYSEQVAIGEQPIDKDLRLTSIDLGRSYTLSITVVLPTGEPLANTPLSLMQTSLGVTYPDSEVVTDEQGKVSLLAFGGEHEIKIAIKGLKEYQKVFYIDKDLSLTISLEEDVVTPFNLQAEVLHDPVSGRNDVSLSWNKQEPLFFDDFEGYDPFTITPMPWEGIDKDKQSAESLLGNYPNRGTLQYVTIVNPLASDPVWWYEYPVLRAYSGKQYAGFIRTSSGLRNDDWLITPSMTIGKDCILSFMAKAGDRYPEPFGVYITTAAQPTIEDFTPIHQGNYESVSYEKWTPMSYSLAAYEGKTVRLAIHYVGNAAEEGAFMLMIDDFYVGPEKDEDAMSAPRLHRLPQGGEMQSGWSHQERYQLYLDDVPYAETSQRSHTFESISEGVHKLGVQALYKTTKSEIVECEINVSNERTAQVTIDVQTDNAISPDSLVCTLTPEDHPDTYISKIIEGGKLYFASLPYDTYYLEIKDPMYHTYQQKVDITGDVNLKIELKELRYTPANLYADVELKDDGSNIVTLHWNQTNVVRESFEECADFATGSFGGWLSVDQDQMPVYPIALGNLSNIVSFPGSGTQQKPLPLAPIVFNPYQTTPAMAPQDPAIMASDGQKLIIFFSSQKAKSDKWLIAPAMKVHEADGVAFDAKAYTTYPESLVFGILTDSADLSTFVEVAQIELEAGTWQTYEVMLEEYVGQKVYPAWHYTTHDGMLTQLDNVRIGAIHESANLYVGRVKHYKVSLDDVEVATTEETSYQFSNLSAGGHKLGVAALYESGLSEVATYTVQVPTALDVPTTDDVNVYIANQRLVITGLSTETPVALYTTDGVLLFVRHLIDGCSVSDLPDGVYIVQLPDRAYRVRK